MKFKNRKWKSREAARFRTNQGTWDITIILSNGIGRFFGRWSKFVKDNDLKENDILLFTLFEKLDIATFDIEVNPIN